MPFSDPSQWNAWLHAHPWFVLPIPVFAWLVFGAWFTEACGYGRLMRRYPADGLHSEITWHKDPNKISGAAWDYTWTKIMFNTASCDNLFKIGTSRQGLCLSPSFICRILSPTSRAVVIPWRALKMTARVRTLGNIAKTRELVLQPAEGNCDIGLLGNAKVLFAPYLADESPPVDKADFEGYVMNDAMSWIVNRLGAPASKP